MSLDALIFLQWHCDSELSKEVIITLRLTFSMTEMHGAYDANILLHMYWYFVSRLWFNFAAKTQAAAQ